MKHQHRGGTIVGFIVGLIVGLGAALAVAVYVTKVPVPFLNKGALLSGDSDAAEARKNRDWDPNAPLYGKSPAKAASAPASSPAPAPADAKADSKTDSKTDSKATADAAKPAASKAEGKPGADPLGDLANAKAAAAGPVDPFDYFVQAGAFRNQQEADAQRAKLAMLGWEARVNEREQNGRNVFRVRIGPFGKRDDAEQIKEKLAGAGVESALVRVQR
ncbi:SPOR domain-containing protein [Comamonas granuli]|uniref:SPOR domain-containing protein n=1 Tax=Comamonas granuli TaxID=290309 RepID=UPI0005A82655|nr:SPOR domain-containing protein [Comamonas granuli]